MRDVTTIGESLLRLSVPAGTRLQSTRQLDVYVGGAESNVASLLARLDWQCGWISGLPENSLGRLAADQLRQSGVDLEAVRWSPGGRIGIYFTELAGPPRQVQVMYDRQQTCASALVPADIDWDYLLDTRIVHLTGITPALSAGCHAIVKEAVERTRARGIPVSFDVNFRNRLWTAKVAARCLRSLMEDSYLLFCSHRDAQLLFSCSSDPADAATELQRCTNAQIVILTCGDGGTVSWIEGQLATEPARTVRIADRIGAGDALAAGVIHGWLQGSVHRGLKYGSLLSALGLSQHGDMVVTTAAELDELLVADDADIQR